MLLWILAQYGLVHLANAKLLTLSVPFVVGLFSVFAGIAVAAAVIARCFIGAFLVSVVCILWVSGYAILLALVMAAFSGDSHRHARRAISLTKLVGTWEPTEQSLNLLFFSEGYHHTRKPHSIALGADGKLEFVSFSRSPRDPTSRYGYLDTTGDWKLTQGDFSKKVYPNRLMLRLDGPRFDLGESFYIMEHDGELALWQGIGDPYSGDYVEYKRVQHHGIAR